ncbi:HAMP domain-containing protein [Bacillus timonensis]|uniref:HAMP domain-containing protein n=2 Tax=Bacillus timonensis TaxID=1033734 RepID=A0A4S3PRP7_9BACI|nr:methyl-accepting chemotaxis protein [Bacillus timonensis]THE12329.1 HAMP domain-containing protein [Bacillus timonensis]
MKNNQEKRKRKHLFNFTIGKRLYITFILIILLPSFMIGFMSYNNAQKEIKSQILATSTASVNLLDGYITDNLSSKYNDVEYFASKLNAGSFAESETSNTIETFTQYSLLHPDIVTIFSGTKDGNMFLYPQANLPEDFDPREREWYKQAIANPGKAIITEPYEDLATGSILVTVAQTINDGSGVIGIDINLESLKEITSSVKIGEKGYAFILTAEKKYLVDPTQETGSVPQGETYSKLIYEKQNGILHDEFQGNEYETAFVTNELTGWKIAGVMEQSEIDQATQGILLSTFWVVAIFIVIGMVIAILIVRSITKPLNTLVQVTDKVSNGDLTQSIKVKNNDEVGQLGNSFNKMLESLRQLLTHVEDKSQTLAASSEQLTASSEQNTKATEQVANAIQEVAVGTEQQTDMVRKATEVVTEMNIGIQQIEVNAQTVSRTSVEAMGIVENGEQAIKESIQQMQNINTSVSDLGKIIYSLGERSEEINQIVNVISDIASQTNLLALNAAIEAARAGEHGKGFAVVADEVRKLAEQSAKSTESIRHLIGTIQEDTKQAVESMNHGTEESAKGINVVNNAGSSFKQIQKFVDDVSSQIQEVSASIAQMTQGAQQVVEAVSEIDEIARKTTGQGQEVSAATEEQLASMEEIASSAASLSFMAEELQDAVRKFRL